VKNKGTLEVTTPSDTDIAMKRVFQAPRRLVFEAMTNPEIVKRWYGPHGHNLVVCEIDLRVGGAWRHVLRDPDGNEIGFRGVYREISPYDRLVATESFDGHPGESLVTTVFVEQHGKTTMTVTASYPSKEVRDFVISTGMEHGAAETYDRLAALLEAR
jgi:uncharacterized protein YndB with AHSA1/START domain